METSLNICFSMSIFDILYLLWGVDWVRSEGQDTILWSIIWLKKKKSGLTKHSQFGPLLNSDKTCICIVWIVVCITQIRIIADNLQVQRSDVTHGEKSVHEWKMWSYSNTCFLWFASVVAFYTSWKLWNQCGFFWANTSSEVLWCYCFLNRQKWLSLS